MPENKFNTPEMLARCVPMSRLQSVLGGKWKIMILWYVTAYRVQRFGELQRRLDGVTQSSLTKSLRELERDGFLENVPGKGCFVAPQNRELLREAQLRKVEEKLSQAVEEARKGAFPLEELHELLDILYRGE